MNFVFDTIAIFESEKGGNLDKMSMIKLTLSSKVQTFKGSSPKNAEQNVNVMTKRSDDFFRVF